MTLRYVDAPNTNFSLQLVTVCIVDKMELMLRLIVSLVVLATALQTSALPQGSTEELKPCGDAYYYPSKVRCSHVTTISTVSNETDSIPAMTAIFSAPSSMANPRLDVGPTATCQKCILAATDNSSILHLQRRRPRPLHHQAPQQDLSVVRHLRHNT